MKIAIPLIIISLFLNSCFTLPTAQTAKTIGKGKGVVTPLYTNLNQDLVDYSLDIAPEEKRDLNGVVGVKSALGINNSLDVEVSITSFKFIGIGFKYNLMGDSLSQFALAIGGDANASFTGSENTSDFNFGFGNLFFSAPLYFSYHPNHRLSVYSSFRPIASIDVSNQDIKNNPIYLSTIGFMLGSKDNIFTFILETGFHDYSNFKNAQVTIGLRILI